MSDDKRKEDARNEETAFEVDDVVRAAATAMFVVDEGLIVQHVSDEALEMLGYEAGEVIGKMTCADLCKTTLCGGPECTIKRCWQTKQSVVGETTCTTRTGEEVPILSQCSAIFDEDGNPAGGMEIITDTNEEQRMLGEVNGLIRAAREGELDRRANPDRVEREDFRDLLDGLNAMLEALIQPINVTADYISRIGEGQIPEKITDDYNGDFNDVKDSINACIDGLQGLIEANRVLQLVATNDYTETVEGDYEGIFAEVQKGVNDVRERLLHVEQTVENIAIGDLGDLEQYRKIGKRSENDNMVPAFIGMMEALQQLIDEMNRMSREHDAGDIDVVIPAERFRGAYAEMAQGVNDMVQGHITVKKKAMACVEQFGRGNFNAELEQFPGKKAFINDTIEGVRENLKGVAAEIRTLSVAVENGDLSIRGNDAGFEGDWEALIGGLNRLVEAFVGPLQEATEVLEAAADRDLTSRMQGDYKGELAELKNYVNRALNAMDESLGQVAAAVVQVAEASGQISSGSQQLAEGSAEQASSLEEVSSSLEEMGAMTRQNAGNAGEARTLSDEAAEGARKGNDAMQRMSEAMDQIQKSSEETAKIVKTIDEIAFQTNLLALNAAVEAARAGDAGKGFAVVAEEVRNLAQRSAEAAKDTADMIEDAVKNAEGGVTISQEVAEALREIASGATNVNELVAEIAAASDEQAQGLEQINTAVGEMDTVTQNNAANSEESASAAEELSAQAQELRGMVETFRLTTARNASGANSLKLVDSKGDSPAPQKAASREPARAIPLDDDEDMAALASF